MQTLDQSLLAKYRDGEISADEAIRCADSANEVRLGIKMFDKRRQRAGSEVDLEIDTSTGSRGEGAFS
jgi:twitching motility protein PilU